MVCVKRVSYVFKIYSKTFLYEMLGHIHQNVVELIIIKT